MFAAGIVPADLAQASDAADFDVTTAWKTRGTGASTSEGWNKAIDDRRSESNYWGASRP
jgi:hypothetical protein